jgi:RNA polymerase sigma-70 factor, ECF subfamily
MVATTAGVANETALMWAEFAAPLRAFVARRVPVGIDPDDVVQDVFVRVMRHLPSLRESDRLDAWLFQIARNALRDAMRARRRREGRTDSLETEPPAHADVEDIGAAETELAPCLKPLAARLAEPYRTAIELTTQHGLTQTEAAKQAGLSVSGMKSRVQRARQQLKEMLLQCCAVAVDRRGGVSDYEVRQPAACGNPIEKRVTEHRRAPGGCRCSSRH